MENNIRFMAAAVLILAAASCVKEIEKGSDIDGCFFSISNESATNSKSTVDFPTGKVYWEPGDQIFVSDGTNSETVVLTKEDIKGTDAEIKTKTISPTAEEYFAFYPANNVSNFDGTSFLISGPTELTGKNTKSGVAKSKTKTLVFKHTGCVFAFTNTNTDVKKVKLIGMNDEKCFPTTYKVDPATAAISDVSEATVSPEVTLVEGMNYLEFIPCNFADGFLMVFLNESGGEEGRIIYKKAFDGARNVVVNLGDIADYTIQKADEYIRNADEMMNFLSQASSRSSGYKAMIVNNIDMKGKSGANASTYNGILEGKNFTIKNLDCSEAPIFSTLNGSVSNIVLDSCSCSNSILAALNYGTIDNVDVSSNCSLIFTGSATGESKFGFIAAYSKGGSISNCDVNGSVNINPASIEKIWAGGVVGSQTKSILTNCNFGGSIDVTISTGGTSCSSVGGVIGRSGDTSCEKITNIKNCKNTANVTVTTTSSNMGRFSVGGVLGQTVSYAGGTNRYGIIESCENTGKVVWNCSSGAPSEAYPSIGGIAGLVEGQIKNCNNRGEVTLNGTSSESSNPLQSASVGGVAGYVTSNASGCHNYAKISVSGYFESRPAKRSDGTTATTTQSRGSSDMSCFGGVFGEAGPFEYNGDETYSVSSCTNEAELNFQPKMNASSSTKPNFCFGGIAGFSSIGINNCNNNAEVSVKTQDYRAYTGGIIGCLQCLAINGCTNSGKVSFDADGSNAPDISSNYQHFVSGILGYAAYVNNVLTSNTNTGSVILSNMKPNQSVFSYLGGIVGTYASGSIQVTACTNNGPVTCNTDAPVRIGGIGGGIVGAIIQSSNTGKITLANSPTLVSGKESAIGGIAGYTKASISDCSSTGDVSSCLEGSYASSFVGSASPAGFIWKNCVSNAGVSGTTIKGSVVGSFTSKGSKTILWSESTVGSKCSSLPLYASAGPSGSTNKVATTFESGAFKIMNFNIRHTANTGDPEMTPVDKGDRNWQQRKGPVVAMLSEQKPDILGICEYSDSKNEKGMTTTMKEDLEAAICNSSFAVKYARAFAGVAKGIYYNTDRFTLVSSGKFYHSDTPEKSSKWEGLSSIRTTAWAKLTEKSSGKTVVFFMTHPDWNPDPLSLKLKSSQLNVDQMKSLSKDSDVQIISGDMNTFREYEYEYMQPYIDYGMKDAFKDAAISDYSYTFNDWGGSRKQSLDYIFVRNVSSLIRFETISSPDYGVTYISDHWPSILECNF